MYKKILVPLDGSKLAEKALEHLKFVTKSGVVERIILMRVVEPILPDIKSNIGAEHLHQAELKREKEAKSYLTRVSNKLKEDGFPIETRLEIDGEPAEKIIELARQEDVDLIIMSTHGRTGFRRWLYGSVASRIINHSPVPILVVVPEEKKKVRWVGLKE